MQKAKEATGKFVKAREAMTKLLHLVEKAFDQGLFSVTPSIILTRVLPILARQDHRGCPMLKDKGNEIIPIKGAIPQAILVDLFRQEGFSLSTFMAFASRQDEAQGITQAIDLGMDFGAKAASPPTQRLGILPTVFLTPPQRRDAPAPQNHRAAHFPNRGRRQNAASSVPPRRAHTNGQSACRHYSSCHIQPEASAIAPHCSASISRLRQSADILFLAPHKPVGKPVEKPKLSSIDRRVVLWLS